MSWIDTLSAALAPEWSLRREVARQRLAQLRKYDAAQRPSKWFSWHRPISGPMTETMDADRIRAAARDLLRNNGYAQRALRTLNRATVGTGIVGTVMQGQRPARGAALEAWKRFEEECDFLGHHDLYGLQRQIVNACYADGDVLVRLRPWATAPEGAVPVQFHVLEIDHLDQTPRAAAATSPNGWVERGIEYDADGRKVAYWVHPLHPHDRSRYLNSRFESERFKADRIFQVYDMLRPGQDIGISILAAAAAPLKDLQDYLEAESTRKRTEACLTAFVTSDGSDGTPLAPSTVQDHPSGYPTVQLAPGAIVNLKPGESVQMATPAGTPDIGLFADQMALLAAAAGGVMFEHLTGNMKHVNYSSYRVGSFDFAGFIEQMQWLVFTPRMLNPMGRAFVRYAKLGRLVSERQALSVKWSPPPAVTSPDPLKDAKANEMNLRLGLVSPSELVGGRGWGHAEKLAEIAADLAASDAVNLMFDGDPRKPRGAWDVSAREEQTNEE